MSFRIQTNVPALQSQRILGQNQAMFQQSIERLSSGFRINRSADDAAGLGIANRYRADSKALSQASRNIDQAGSILTIAEGAVNVAASILDRMKVLGTQAASDSVTTSGRALIDQEFTGLRNEIDRIVNSTRFQGTQLLDNSFGVGVDVASGALTGASSVIQSGFANGLSTGTFTIANGTAGQLTLTDGTITQTVQVAAGGSQVVNFAQFGVSIMLRDTYDNTVTNDTGAGDLVVALGAGGGQFMVGSSGQYSTVDMLSLGAIDLRTGANSLELQTQQLDTLSSSQTALFAIDRAILAVSTVLGNIGSTQNRIDYAQQNVKTAYTNTVSAESVIRDLDMADEMTRFSKAQILVQAGTAMLAQANASTASVLTLLRGG